MIARFDINAWLSFKWENQAKIEENFPDLEPLELRVYCLQLFLLGCQDVMTKNSTE